MILFQKFLGWEIGDPTIDAAIRWGVFAAVFVHYAHDWLSVISVFIQMILFRKKPMTFDERFPFFLVLVIFPSALLQSYFPEPLRIVTGNPWTPWIASGVMAFAFISLPSLNRRLKSFFVWNAWDSAGLGLAHLFQVFQGVGHLSPFFAFATWKHYQWDAVIKYSFLCATPFILIDAIYPPALASATSISGLFSLNVVLAFALSSVTGYFAVNSVIQAVELRRLSSYGWYRAVTVVVGGVTLLFF